MLELFLFDELPELRAFFEFLVILDIEVRADKEILQAVAVEDVMNHELVAFFFEVNSVFLKSKAKNGASRFFDFTNIGGFFVERFFSESGKLCYHFELFEFVDLGEIGCSSFA